ncbi:MAG: cytochrome c biogenesis protein CcsA [Chloroflexi bacterium]|nr:cytochrome c biogenesis protein CcsA [Chloroflexota bacterium]
MRQRGSSTNLVLLTAALVLMVAALYLVFMWVPTALDTAGDPDIAQRIFYFHVPSAWVAFLSFFIVFVFSILYLVKKQARWDTVAYSAAEIGVLFTSIALVSGSIWARSAWGAWWVWDGRLTTTLVLWLIYMGYLMVRAYSQATQARSFAAVVGIVGFIDVPIVFMAIQWWRTQHPEPVVRSGGLDPSMLYTLLVSLAAFTVFYVLLLRMRTTQRRMEAEAEMLRAELEMRRR